MRADVADRFAQLDRNRAEVTYQPLPELNASGDGQSSGEVRANPADWEGGEGGGDFELAGGFADAPRRPAAPPSPAPPGGDEDEDEFVLGGSMAGAFSASPAQPPPAPPRPAAAPEEPAGEPESETYPVAAGEGGKPADPPPADPPAPRRGPDEEEAAHSEATGGDALLEIALQESGRSTGRGRRRAGLVVKGDKLLLRCPAGHPVRVARKHAGKVGRCPHPGCGLKYLVPDVPPDPAAGAEADDAAAPAAPAGPPDPSAAGAFTRYVEGVRLHAVVPDKVKKKPDSQAKAFAEADLALSPEALLVLTLEGKRGPFGFGGEKPAQVREKARAHLAGGGAVPKDLPCPHLLLAAENAGEVAVEYPPAYPHESAFGGEPVFGAGRVALRLPHTGGESGGAEAGGGEVRFVSLTLSQFRRFAAAMEEFGFASDYAAGAPIPRTDEAPTHAGHYTDAEVPELPRPDLYLADPALNAVVSGYRCESCGLIVSEDGRKKEKLGGANGKGLAKAKCPKCGEPFGNRPLYKLAK